MALPVTDTFSQSTGFDQQIDAYSTAWSVREGSLIVPSGANRVEGAGGTYNTAYRNDETFNANQYAQAVLAGGSAYRGVACRVQSSDNSSYHVETDLSVFYLSKCRNGTQSTLASAVSQTFVAGDVIRLEVTGTSPVTLKVYRALAASPTSFTQVGSTYTDDGSIGGTVISSAGAGGVFVYGVTSGIGLSSFEAGNLGGGGGGFKSAWVRGSNIIIGAR